MVTASGGVSRSQDDPIFIPSGIDTGLEVLSLRGMKLPRLIVAILTLGVGGHAAADRPNILWITSEDNNPHLGAYGFEYAHTPALDALAAESAIYTKAFATAGVCAPARSTIITGMYPPALGSEHMRSRVRVPDGVKFYPAYLRAAGYYCTNNSKTDYNLVGGDGAWDESSGKAHWKNRPEGKPFFAIFNHTVSHESKIRLGEKSFPHHEIDAAPVPPYHPDVPEVRRDWAQYHANLTKLDTIVARNLRELEEAGLADETIVFYYGDHGSGMPRHKRWLWDSGIHIPLLVRIPDKWKHLRECAPGEKTDRLVSFVDLAPTVLSLAGVRPPEHMHGKAFLGEFAAAPRDYVHAFRGRMDERYDMVRAVRDGRFKYLRNYNPHQIFGQHISYMFQTDTTRKWKAMFDAGELDAVQSAFWQTKPYEELYDTAADPHEVSNLAGDPAQAETLARLRAEMDRWQVEIGDLGLLPEGEMHARAGGDPPHALGRDRGRYALEEVMAAAATALTAGEGGAAKLRALMGDGDAAKRYWGVVGALHLGAAGAPLAGDLQALLADPNGDVKAVAAHALYRLGEKDGVLEALSGLMRDPNAFVRLRAINVLDEMGEDARPEIERIAREGDVAKTGAYGENYIERVIETACANLGVAKVKPDAAKGGRK